MTFINIIHRVEFLFRFFCHLLVLLFFFFDFWLIFFLINVFSLLCFIFHFLVFSTNFLACILIVFFWFCFLFGFLFLNFFRDVNCHIKRRIYSIEKYATEFLDILLLKGILGCPSETGCQSFCRNEVTF